MIADVAWVTSPHCSVVHSPLAIDCGLARKNSMAGGGGPLGVPVGLAVFAGIWVAVGVDVAGSRVFVGNAVAGDVAAGRPAFTTVKLRNTGELTCPFAV
jgi:hypothetical protein